jgi:hypothetical protein
MALGRKTGGRVRGTPNRRTHYIEALLAHIGCDPIEGMARIAMDSQNPIEIRARMYAELAQYVAPKRKAVQIASDSSSPVVFNIGIERRKNGLLSVCNLDSISVMQASDE